MAITFWRNVQRKITTQEMDASFDTLVNDIANAGISSEMPEANMPKERLMEEVQSLKRQVLVIQTKLSL